MEDNNVGSLETWLKHLRGVVGVAVLWGALWSLGMIAVLVPILPHAVNLRGVLGVGAIGFLAGGVLSSLLAFVCRNKDLTDIGVGGLGLLRQKKTVVAVHVLGTTWIAIRLLFFWEAFGFPGVVDVIALSATLFTLPIWAFAAAIIRLVTKFEGRVLFFWSDLVSLAVVFPLFRYAFSGFG